jgi:hypothetical protein
MVNSIVKSIYTKVLAAPEKIFYHEIQFADRVFYTTNMTAILEGLKELFPNAYIAHTLVATGSDGKMYDVARLDDVTIRHVSKTNDNSYILVDLN